MDDRSPDMLRPTLIAGALFGTLAAIPVVQFLNCACCALVIGCGLLASYLYAGACRRQGIAFRPGNGALVGLIAGAFYALAATLVGTVVQLAFGDAFPRWLLERLQDVPSIPPEAMDQLERALEESGTFRVVGLVMSFFLNVLVGAIFSTLGGLIGGALFKVEPSPPRPPVPPMPPPGVPGSTSETGTTFPPHDGGI